MTINPFTLKELRQLTRAKTISGALIAFLFISLALAYFVPVAGVGQTTGQYLFMWINGVLTVMLCVILPGSAFARFSGERGGAKDHADFTLMTALPPAAVIDGKLRSAFALMALFASAALPFGIFAYLLHGITFAEMLRCLAVTVCYSCVLVHVSLAIAALKVSKTLRNILFSMFFFGVVVSTVPACFFVCEVASTMSLRPFVVMLAATATACIVLRAYAIAFFAPVVMERETPLRVAMLLGVLGWGGYAVTYMREGVSAFEIAYGLWLTLSVAAVLALAAFAAAQPVGYSRRILAARPASCFKRVMRWPFVSGAANGFVFACLLAVPLAFFQPAIKPWMDAQYLAEGITSCASGHCSTRTLEYPYYIATFLLYALSLLLIARAIWRVLARRAHIAPVFVPIVAGLVLVFMQSLPALLSMDGLHEPGDYAAMPFYLRDFCDHPLRHALFAAIAFGVGGLLNIVAIFKALGAELSAPKKRKD